MHNQFSPQCLPIKCIPLIRWRYVLFILSYKSFSSLLCFSSDLQKMFDKSFSEVSEMDNWTMPNFCLAEWWSSVIGAVICMVMHGNWYVSFLPILFWLDYCFLKIKDSFLSTTMKSRLTSLTCLLLYISPLPESDWAEPWHLSITLNNPPDELSIKFSNQFK